MKKVVLLGDSITQGLGSKKINFTEHLQEILGADFEITNLAYTGTTIDYPLGLVTKDDFPECDYCVIVYGNVDAQIRPNREGKLFPLIPRRFKGNGMLMPRPFYSSKPHKAIIQHGENLFRRFLSESIRLVDGTEQWVSPESFSAQYRKLVDTLTANNARCICCSTVFIDEHLFRGSTAEYLKFNASIKEIAESTGQAYIDLYAALQGAVSESGWEPVYNHDRFHPNGGGYKLIANLIAEEILSDRQAGPTRSKAPVPTGWNGVSDEQNPTRA